MYGHLGCAALLSLLLGCTALNPSYGAETGEEGDSEPGATTRPDPSLPSGPSEPPSPTSQSTGGQTDGEASTDPTTHTGPETGDRGSSSQDTGGSMTGPDSDVCSIYDQDCPGGDKCMPWATDGGAAWNALSCFPIDPDPHSPGDSCTVDLGPTSGVDDCDVSSMCWNVDSRTSTGTCTSFCMGSHDAPECDDPAATCVQGSEGVIALCLPSCDPLAGNCTDGLACLPAADGFGCVPDASGGKAQVGDMCEFVNTCGPGNLCVASAELLGCGSAQCCTSICDLIEGDACNEGSVCLPFYADGVAPPGYENVGYCGAA